MTAGQASGPASVREERLAGMPALVLENDHLAVTVLPRKGADIYALMVKALNRDVLYKTPMGLHDPRDVPASPADPRGVWVDRYEGGWQVVLPNGGNPCEYRGARLGLNDEVCNLAWDWRVADTGPDEARVVLKVSGIKTPFRMTRTLSLGRGRPFLAVGESLSTDSREPVDFMWGQHLAFDGAWLRSGGYRLWAPCTRCRTNTTSVLDPDSRPPGLRLNRFPTDGDFPWPRAADVDGRPADLTEIPDPSVVSCDMLYLDGFDAGWFALAPPEPGPALAMTWPARDFPYLWYYQNFHGSNGYPWYGRADFLALEPFTGYPAFGLIEALTRGNHRTLEPGGRMNAVFRIGVVNHPAGPEDLPGRLSEWSDR